MPTHIGPRLSLWGLLGGLAAAVLLGWWCVAPLLGASGLSEAQRGRLWLGLMALMLALGLAGAVLFGQWQASRRAARSLGQAAAQLRRGTWEDAVLGLRRNGAAAPAAFSALAQQLELLLGESERRWRARTELSAEWYFELDDQHRFCSLDADALIAKPAGRALGDLLGRRHDELPFLHAPAEGWDAFHGRLDRLEPLQDVEFEVDGLGGNTRGWVSVQARARRRRGGPFAGYEGVARDITQAKAAWRRLHDSEQRHALMASLSADWYWATDAQHRYTQPEAEMLRRFGSLAVRAVGRTRWETYPQALTPALWQQHRQDLDNQRPFRALEFAINDDDGRLRWVSISGAPRFDVDGRFLGYHGVGRDISLRKQSEALLLQHNRELQQAVASRTRELELANRDLDAFARQLAHELRSPLGQVQGLAGMLRQRLAAHLQEADAELLDLQCRAAQNMLATFEALLELARSSSEAIERRETDLSELAQEVIASLPSVQRASPVDWQVQGGLRAWAAPTQLRIVLHNLLGNAAKFTRQTAAPRVVFEGQAQSDGQVLYRIVDNGAGFESERAGRLFQPFTRLHAERDFQGTGIGLTIVQRIVQRHGGQIQAHGAPGLGACVEFTLGQREAPRHLFGLAPARPSSVEYAESSG